MHLLSLAGLSLLASVANASLQIVPGATWTATNIGQSVQAHGGGIIQNGVKWYWVGEDKTNGSAFQNINCYSSSNLVEWNYEGAVLTRTSSGDTGPNRVIERPKIMHNKKTGKYVLRMHIDSSDYKDARIGVAISDTVCGKYTYLGSERPLGFQSRDAGVFIDDDDKGYLLTEDRENGLRIDALSDDYLNVTSNVHTFAEKYEAPALFKSKGVYFILASRLTGWDPNDNYYSTSKSLSGPWSSWQTFANPGSNTYSSQTTFVLPVGNHFMYMGDRWHGKALSTSTYLWLPLNISGTTATMKNAVNWIINPNTGAVTATPKENTYEGETGTLAGGARTVSCTGCSGSQAAGYIGGASSGTVTFSNVQSSATTRTTVRIKYHNRDNSPRYADVSVNGKTQKVAFLSSNVGSPATSVVHVDLKQGSNEIKIGGSNGGYGPDIDQLIVPTS